jgi:CDP-4-dehydro-6-deoxyglucose reductase, E1
VIPLMKNAFLNERESKEELAEFIRTADRLSMHVKCLEFEREFSAREGKKHAILFNSGGSANLALIQAYKNLGRLHDGDCVGFSALTWSTNVMPIIQLGLRPIAIDIDPRTLNVMSANLEETLSKVGLKALFTTNALGMAGDLDEVRRLCDEQGVLFLEDNCEALGTELPGGRTGGFGEAATYSFFVAHHMSTIEGGMICTDNDELSTMCRIVRANGWDRNLSADEQIRLRQAHGVHSELEAKYAFYDLGFNLRPTEITGFLGLQQLRYLDANIESRWANHLRLEEVARSNPDLFDLDHGHIKVLSSFAFPVVTIDPELRTKYLAKFSGAAVEIRPMIAGNIQRQPFFKKYVGESFPLPGADFIHETGFYFGNYPELTEIDLEVLSICLREY